jgi:glutamate synthase (NADPH) large chain
VERARPLGAGGHLSFRVGGEAHLWGPEAIASLQKAVRLSDARSYDAYARAINDQGDSPCTLRGLWDLRMAERAIPIEEVEPAAPCPSAASPRRRTRTWPSP